MLIDLDHETKQSRTSYGKEGEVRYPCNVHGHGSSIVDRVHPRVFEVKPIMDEPTRATSVWRR